MIPTNLIDLSDGISVWEWARIAAAVGAFVGLVAGLLKLVSTMLELGRLRDAEKVRKKLSETASTSSFSKEEIRDSLKNYIVPDCAQSDPSNHSDLRFVADVRENVMDSVDRFIGHGEEYRHLLMLADSGMGKTTFCLNYFERLSRTKKISAAVVPLGRPDALKHIANIEVKSDCVLMLDAFDEDPAALKDAEGRIKELMDASADFMAVIITCRSQFFANDASIPTRTGVSIVRPRKAGEAGEYRFSRLYLLPFSSGQVDRYLKANFAWWNWRGLERRQEARRLIKDIPELSVRPMLLALIPDLIRSGERVRGLFDLYKFMVDSWLEREKNWIAPESLLRVSQVLAVRMYNAKFKQQPDRISALELNQIAKECGIKEAEWKHLTARSLLNRDSDGNFKFSHRSVMEYLYVKSAIDGEGKCFDFSWTDMMRDMFVSWGHTAEARTKASRAQEILALDLGKLGLAPLASPLARARTIRSVELRAALDGSQPSGRRIPSDWRPQSIRTSKVGGSFVVRDLQFDLEWTVPDSSALDETVLLDMVRSKAEAVGSDSARLPSTEEFISLVEIDQRFDENLIDENVFYWLGDQLGRARYLVASVGQEVLSHDALRSLGRSELKTPVGHVWVYEVIGVPRMFGDKVKSISARVLSVKPGDSGLYRKLAMMSPDEYHRHISELDGQLELILSESVRQDPAAVPLTPKRKAKPSPRSRRPRP
jgi:hypothetical protein